MNAQQIITIAISTVALVISLVSIALQYNVRVGLKYRINDVAFVSLLPTGEEPRSVALAVNLSFFNLGNRPAAVESIALRVADANFAASVKNPPKSCTGTATILVPISRSSYGELSIEPFVIEKEAIVAREVVFDMFHYNKTDGKVHLAGVVCLDIKGSDFRGNTTTVSIPVAVVDVAITRPDNVTVSFDTRAFKRVGQISDLLEQQ